MMKELIQNKYLVYLFFALLLTVLYIPVLDNDFATRDDKWMLYGNPDVVNLGRDTISHAFTAVYNGQYSPLNTLYYALVYYFVGPNAFWFNLLSLIAHIASTILVYKVTGKLLILKGVDPPIDNRAEEIKPIVALLVALFFAIHPVQVESVAWISASKIIFSSFFLLAALNAYLDTFFSKNKFHHVAVVAFFLIALGFKEQSVILPVLIVLVDLFIARERAVDHKYILRIAPLFLISLAYGFFSLRAQDIGFHDMLNQHYYPFWQRAILSSYSVMEYLFKSFLPINLLKFYKFPMVSGDSLPLQFIFYPLVFFTTAIFALFVYGKEKTFLRFGSIFFITNVALVLHIFPMGRGALMADRYLYLALIGIFLPLTYWMINNIVQKKASRLYYGLILTYCLYLGCYTFYQTYHWS